MHGTEGLCDLDGSAENGSRDEIGVRLSGDEQSCLRRRSDGLRGGYLEDRRCRSWRGKY